MIRIFFLPRRARVLASLGFLGVFASVVAYAQLGGSSGVVLPYIGHLEKDGVALDSLGVDVRFRFTLWNAPTGGTACGAQYLEEAPVSAGRFAVEIGPVAESCVVAREVYLGVEVDEGDGFVALAGRQRVVPALAASTSGTGDLYVAEDVVVDGALDVGEGLVVGGDSSAARLRLSSTSDVNAADGESGALRIGTASGTNLALDNNEIMARNGGAPSELFLNYEGGTVTIGTASSHTNVRGSLSAASIDTFDLQTGDLRVTGEAKGFVRGGGSRLCTTNSATLIDCTSWGTGDCLATSGSCAVAAACSDGTVVWNSHLARCYHPGLDNYDASCRTWLCVE